ncbi:MAG: T9SS type A sorting domain-containing protein [Flavobacteriaceae bacterium]|nr:T9SS type A sorting domain-containing protein [Flavobacteriaceae bacterium]
MKNKKTRYYVAFLFSIGMLATNAQENTVSSGANATGAGGSVSYTVGQAFYITSTDTAGSVSQGVQQPIEIQVLLGVEEHEINLYAKVYPNPTTDMINLSIGNTDASGLSYQLFDYSGRILSNNKIADKNTTISMLRYPKAIYLLSVTKGNKTIKTFKILKN